MKINYVISVLIRLVVTGALAIKYTVKVDVIQRNRKYKSAMWKRIRAQAISKSNGLCEECIKKGKISYYDDVHHKIPIKVDISKAYDLNNLICLCRTCHIKAHKALNCKGEGGVGKF